MTVATDAPSEEVFAGAGSAAPLQIQWAFLDGDDLVVTAVAGGVENDTPLVRGIDYEIAGGGTGGGTVTPLAPIAIGTSWRVRRETPRGQPASFPSGSYNPAQHELAHDRQGLVSQEQERELGRAVQVPRGESGFTVDPLALRQALPFALFNAADGRLTAASATTMANALIEALMLLLPTTFKGDKGDTGSPGSVAGYSGELVSDTPGGSAGSRFRATLGDMIDGGGDNNRADMRINRANATWAANHGGSGAPYAYNDQTASVTVNMDGNSTLLNPENSGLGWFWEPKFWQAGVFAFEHQLRFRGLDGVERRPIQWFFPESGSARGVAEESHQADKVNWFAWDNVEIFAQWNLQNGTADWGPLVSFNFSKKAGAAVLKQLNVAGNAFLALPYFDADEFEYHSGPQFTQANARLNTPFGVSVFTLGQCLLLPANGWLDAVLSQGATAGACIPFLRQVNSSGTAASRIENLGAGAVTFDLVSGGAGTGYLINGAKVLGPLGAAIADPAYTAGDPPTKGEFDALVDTVRAILARMRAASPSIAT